MQAISPPAVRYIKLGKGAAWFDHARVNNLLELGHAAVSRDVANTRDPEAIRASFVAAKLETNATRFTREVMDFMTLPEGSLWLTFQRGHLWWALAGTAHHWLGEADHHGLRGRSLLEPWRQTDLADNLLSESSLSGRLTKVAAYRQSICEVEASDYAVRRINGLPSCHVAPARAAQASLAELASAMIAELDPSDFEILVDLTFAHGGWRRLSAIGGFQVDHDIVLQHPTSGARAFVQIKSRAGPRAFTEYLQRYRETAGFSHMFFVVHTPIGKKWPTPPPDASIWAGRDLTNLVLSAGLFDWLLERSR